MAAGDRFNIPIKDGGGTTRQMQFEEQADGSYAALNVGTSGLLADNGGTEYTLSSGGTQAITRASGKNHLEVWVVSGSVNVRADGTTATATTGRPVSGWNNPLVLSVAAASLYALEASTVRVISS